MIILDDFNAKSSNCYKRLKRTYEGSKIDAIAPQFGLQKAIQEAVPILSNGLY